MPTSEPGNGRLATIEANLANHFKVDEDQARRNDANAIEIKGMIRELAADLKGSVQRLHESREEDAAKARHLAANVASVADVKIVAVEKIANSAHQRIDGQKIWMLSQIILAGLMALSAMAWLYDHFSKAA